MELLEILEMMGRLQLSGMRAAYDEIVTSGVKRQQRVERVIAALSKAEIAFARQDQAKYMRPGISRKRSNRKHSPNRPRPTW